MELAAQFPAARSKEYKGKMSHAPQTQSLTGTQSREGVFLDSCPEGVFNSARQLEATFPIFFYTAVQNCMQEESYFLFNLLPMCPSFSMTVVIMI